MYNQVLLKNQTKKIWFRNGTFSSASVNLPLPTSIPFPVTPSLAPIQARVASCCTGQQIEIITYPNSQIGNTYVIDGLCYTLIQLNTTGRVAPIIYERTFDDCSSCISSNPCPTPTPTPTISLTPTITRSPNVTSTPTPTNSITPSPTKTQTQTPTVTRTPNATLTPTVTPTITRSPDATSTLTPTSSQVIVTPTTTPSVTPTLNLCTSFISPPQTVNGVTITESFSGSVTPYIFAPATCCNNTFVAPAGGVWLGNGGGGCPGPFFPFEYTLNFSTAVNDVDLVIYGGGCTGPQEETFTFTTNGGVPVLTTQGVFCHSSISGNTVHQGLGGWTTNFDAPFIKFKVTGPESFTTLTVTGPGGRLGSILGLCSDSIPVAPTPTPTPTQEFCADVRNGDFDECNPISSINGLNCNCYTGATSNVTNYTSGCIPFWFKGDSNDHVTVWSNTPPYYSGTTYLELNAFVTPTATPNPTPTPSPTNGVTPTPTITPSSTSALLTLGVYVSVDSSIPPLSGTVWYSVRNGAYIPTQPFPTQLTWTQLGSVVSIPQCNSSIYVGDIDMNVNDIAYLQIRNETGTCLYKNEAGPLPIFEPCTYSGALTDLYTNSFIYGFPGNESLGIKVVSPLEKTASPFGFAWIYQDINVTNIASPYSIEFAHLGRVGYSNTMRAGVSGDTTGMQFFTGEFTGSTTGWTVHTETGYVFNVSDTQRKLVFSSTTCDDGGNFIDGVVMDCQSFAVTPTPTSSSTPTPTVTPTVSPSCAQSVFIFIPNL